jgi:hypothetical protein
MVNTAEPVLVTTTTGWVIGLFTTLFPKSNDLVLSEAVVSGEPCAALAGTTVMVEGAAIREESG